MAATASERRAAAELRRRAASEAGDRDGDRGYAAYRAQVPGVGAARRVPTAVQLRAKTEEKDGKQLVHTDGFFCRYDIAYPMWDSFGEYHERVAVGAGRRTIAAKPDVAFLVNHGGVTMARTINGSLTLEERREGGWHDAWLNPKRQDVSDLVVAIEDNHIDQMSFAFMIPDGEGLWSEDFTEFEIRAYDLDRGDVSAVNYGASPYTDISARAAEILQDLDRLPDGAAREAAGRLVRRGFALPGKGAPVYARERIEVGAPVEPVVIARSSNSSAVKRLASRRTRTAGRFVELAAERGLSVAELAATGLPWYEVRNADGDPQERGEEEGVATVFIFDEIGGSFGVDAKTFAMDLEDITAPDIKVRINSPGGSVFDGIAIHSALLHHPSVVSTFADGLAASAASVIFMASNPYDPETGRGGGHMMPGAELMLHKASMTTDGNDDDHAKGAAYLKRQSENLAGMYASRAGGDVAEWMGVMAAETWYFADEAVEARLADVAVPRQVAAPADMTERMKRRFDLSAYRYAGRRAAPDPREVRRATASFARGGVVPAPGVVDLELSSAADQRATEERSTADEPRGRSIALIEAQIAALTAED